MSDALARGRKRPLDDSLEIQVVGMDGEGFKIQVSQSMTGSEIRKIIRDRLPWKVGARVAVLKGFEKLALQKTLTEQGLAEGQSASLSYAYEPANLQEAWRCIQGFPVEDESMALEGILQLEGLNDASQLKNLAGLQSLTFGDAFNQSLKGVHWPSSIQDLTFGDEFNQSLEGVAWPSRLDYLTFGEAFNQSLVGVAWPDFLQTLKFGRQFNQSLEGVAWPSRLENLTFGEAFNQSLVGVAWPDSLQTLQFGRQFNQSLEGVAWPSRLENLTFGEAFNQSLVGVAWPDSLQTLKFGRQFNQSLVGVVWPSNLKILRFAYGSSFNQSLDEVTWPSSLQILTLGTSCNQPLQALQGTALPGNLQTLEFRYLDDRRRLRFFSVGSRCDRSTDESPVL